MVPVLKNKTCNVEDKKINTSMWYNAIFAITSELSFIENDDVHKMTMLNIIFGFIYFIFSFYRLFSGLY